MFQTVGDDLFICGPLVYSAGKQEPWQTVSEWCARQQFPLWLLSLPDWQSVWGRLICDKRFQQALRMVMCVVQQDSEETAELLFIIRTVLGNNLEFSLFSAWAQTKDANAGSEHDGGWKSCTSESGQVAEFQSCEEHKVVKNREFSNKHFD